MGDDALRSAKVLRIVSSNTSRLFLPKLPRMTKDVSNCGAWKGALDPILSWNTVMVIMTSILSSHREKYVLEWKLVLPFWFRFRVTIIPRHCSSSSQMHRSCRNSILDAYQHLNERKTTYVEMIE